MFELQLLQLTQTCVYKMYMCVRVINKRLVYMNDVDHHHHHRPHAKEEKYELSAIVDLQLLSV